MSAGKDLPWLGGIPNNVQATNEANQQAGSAYFD
jgi:hypothetical protein